MKRLTAHGSLLLLLPLALWLMTATGHAAAPPAPAQAAPVSPALSPGVMVCEPVATHADIAGANFGAGCSYWLQMSVGGLPQLGQTPLWAAFARARTEMGRADMRLAPSQAAPLASILGVTHVAVGTVTGSTAHRTLTYRLRTVPSGMQVGPALQISGTDAQIAGHLPEMARALALRLGVTSPNILSMTGTTAADLQELGRVRWLDFRDLPPSQQQAFAAMAARVPLAGLMNLSRNSGGTDTQMDASVQTILAQAPGNALVWGEIAEQGGWFLLPHAARLAALAKRFPGCYNLARAQEALARHTHDLAAQDAAARRMVRDAPRNPNAWLSLEKSLSDQSEAIRQGRVFDDLTPPEVNIVTRLYPQAQRAAAHATALAPCDSDAWTIFAEDATFNSDSRTVDTAIKKALRLPGNKADAYRWGLQMYQPKWGGDPAMLARVAHRAAYDATLNDNQTLEVAYDVEESGFAPLAHASWIARRRAQIAARPQVGWLYWGLATVLNKRGDGPGSDREFVTAEALMPGVAAVHFDHADALSRRDNHSDAIREYQDGLRLDPQNRSAHKDLGWEYKHAGRLDETVRDLTLALHIDPYNGLAHYYLGDVHMLQNRPAEAAQEYRAAARDVVYKASLQHALAYALNTAGQTDAAIAAGLDAIRLDPRSDDSVYATVADASLHKHDWDTALRMSEIALSINAQDSVAHENMAEAYLGKGDLPHARAEWQAVLTLGDPRMTALAQEYLRKYP